MTDKNFRPSIRKNCSWYETKGIQATRFLPKFPLKSPLEWAISFCSWSSFALGSFIKFKRSPYTEMKMLTDKSIKSILLDNNRLISLNSRSKSIITKYISRDVYRFYWLQSWYMYYSWMTKGHQDKSGEIMRNQSLRVRSKEVLTNSKWECFRALPL